MSLVDCFVVSHRELSCPCDRKDHFELSQICFTRLVVLFRSTKLVLDWHYDLLSFKCMAQAMTFLSEPHSKLNRALQKIYSHFYTAKNLTFTTQKYCKIFYLYQYVSDMNIISYLKYFTTEYLRTPISSREAIERWPLSPYDKY